MTGIMALFASPPNYAILGIRPPSDRPAAEIGGPRLDHGVENYRAWLSLILAHIS